MKLLWIAFGTAMLKEHKTLMTDVNHEKSRKSRILRTTNRLLPESPFFFPIYALRIELGTVKWSSIVEKENDKLNCQTKKTITA
jgi:hypothetical protein